MVRSVHLWPTCWSWFYGLGGGSFHMAGSIQSCWFEAVYAGDPLLSGHVIETRTRARIKFADKDYLMYEKGSSRILLIWSLPCLIQTANIMHPILFKFFQISLQLDPHMHSSIDLRVNNIAKYISQVKQGGPSKINANCRTSPSLSLLNYPLNQILRVKARFSHDQFKSTSLIN